MAEERSLPGWPKKRLVKEVRQHLRLYFGAVPKIYGDAWRLAWEWADQVADSYMGRKHWPSPAEIATQYMVLLLAAARESYMLRLPCRAAKEMPPAVAELLGRAQARSRQITVGREQSSREAEPLPRLFEEAPS